MLNPESPLPEYAGPAGGFPTMGGAGTVSLHDGGCCVCVCMCVCIYHVSLS
jgi:hypothetical protein